MIPNRSFPSFLCDWINYVSLTLLEVSKHTFSVISHQSMWPWRWKVKHVKPGSWTERDQPIDFRANPISPQHAAQRTEIIPMGYVQWALRLRFVAHDHISRAYKNCISNAGQDDYHTGQHVREQNKNSTRRFNSKIINALLCRCDYF